MNAVTLRETFLNANYAISARNGLGFVVIEDCKILYRCQSAIQWNKRQHAEILDITLARCESFPIPVTPPKAQQYFFEFIQCGTVA